MDFENKDLNLNSGLTEEMEFENPAGYGQENPSGLQLGLQATSDTSVITNANQNMVVLPAGVELDDIQVSGRDLVVTLPDGGEMIIPDGAVFVPQIVIGGVTVPPLNLAALLVGNEPQPAAGPPQSSGGNFADPVGDIGDPFPLGDLLPPTALAFPEPENEEIFPFEPDEDDDVPSTIIITPDNPTGAVSATSSVDESGLPARGSEPEGTNAEGDGETVTGTIIFNPGDGPAVVSIDGVAITAVGQTISGTFGTLTITSISNGSIGYSYTLADNTDGDNTSDVFAVSVVDVDGDTATADLTINIIDDVPTAVADIDSIAAGEYGPATGNVITDAEGDGGADTQGADGAVVAGVSAGDTGAVLLDAGTVGTQIAGLYGVLTLNADGSYSYSRNEDSPGGVSDVFTYTIQDGDGDTSVTTLTIDVADSPVTLTLPVSGEAGAVVDEEGLPARGSESPGSNEASDVETTTGTITYDAADGPATVTINGVAVTAVGQTFVGSFGTLTITGIANGAITYSYTLADNTSGDNTSDDFAISVTDADGDNASGTLSIAIIDDVPMAEANAAVQLDDDALAGGNAGGTGDVDPDTANTSGTLGHVFGADSGSIAFLTTGAPAGFTYELSGNDLLIKQGATTVITVTLDPASGAYTVIQNAPIVHADGGDENDISFTLNYRVTDGDGDTDDGTLQINVDDDTPTVAVTNETEALVVDESDLTTDASGSFAGIFTGSFGADGAGSLVYTLGVVAGPSGLVDTATGQNVILSLNGGVIEGRTETGGDLVFTITVAADGTVTLDQIRAVVHANSSDPDDAAFLSASNLVTLTATITDADNDQASATAEIGSSFVFRDDGPSIDAAVVDNDSIMLVTQDADTIGMASDTAVSTGNFGGAFSIASSDFGADGAGSISWAYALVVNNAASGLTSNGVDITLVLNGTVVEGRAGGELIFSIGVDASTGVVTLSQFAEIDHALPGDSSSFDSQLATLANGLVSLEGTATIIDRDGDSASETVSLDLGGNIKFADDGPTVADGDSFGTVDEDGLTGGIAGGTGDVPGEDASVSGSVVSLFNSGADAPLTYQLLTDTSGLPALTSGGVAITYSVVGNVLTASAGTTTIFTFTLDATTGAWTFVLSGPLDHADGMDENDVDINFGSLVQATDDDGDFVTAAGSVVVTVDDDTPTATNEASQDVNEGATVTGTLDFAGGADGATVTAINGTTLVFGPDGFSQSIDIGDGVIKVKADGSYEFTADATTVTPTPPTTATFTVTDGDNDTVTATVTFQVVDANVPTAGTSAAEVDDDGLTGGNPASTIGDLADTNADGDNDETTFSGTLALTFGADGPGSVGFAAMDGQTAMVGQEMVTFSWNAGSNTLTATGPRGDLFTVEVTDPTTGAYKVTLLQNVLHAQGPNDENDALAPLTYTVTDSDGSTANGTLNVTFDDDAPTATDEASQDVNEGATVTGTLDFAQGADGATVSHVGVTALVFGQDGFSQSIDIGGGSIRVKADGSYEFTADNPTNSPVPPTSAVFTVTDGDGDTATATVSFQVVDANVPTGGDTVAAVDDDGLTGGNPASTVGDLDANAGDLETASEAIFQGVLNFSFGGDGAGMVDFAAMNGLTAMVGQEMVTFAWDGGNNTLTATGPRGDLFTVEVTNPTTGAFTVTLLDNVLHAQGPNDENDAFAALNYTVTDADGSTATGTLSLTFDDDAPTAVNDTAVSVAEDAVGTVGGNVLTNDSLGADGGTMTSVTIGGTTTAIMATGVTTVVTANGTYTFTAAGVWTFDPNANLDQSAGDIDASFTYTITDGDGDTASATQPISISDGADPVAGPPINLTLDDENLADGSDPAVPVTDMGDIVFTPGSDAIASIVFGGVGSLSGGLTWVRVSDTQITGSDGGTVIVTLDLTVVGTTTTIKATLSDNYDSHPGIDLDDLQALGSVGVVATDSDGDTATGTVNISVSDDLPVLMTTPPADGALTVDETDLGVSANADFSALFTPDYNADGPAAINPITYALGVSAPGADSGLDDVATGQDVLLRVNGLGQVEGYIDNGGAGIVVFTLSIDAAGQAVLTQARAVTHGTNPDPNDGVGLSAANLITLSATITDGDGDTDTETIDIGASLTFLDDGPSIDAAVVDADTVMLVTQDAETIGAASDTATSVANFGGAFSIASSSYGADGAGTIIWSYALAVDNAVSGLSSNGVDIVLSLNGTVVEGRAGGDLIFTIATDATTGVVTLTQFAEIDHVLPGDSANYDAQLATLANGLVSLNGTATITDGDGDTASETVSLDLGGNVKFADDGPAIDAAVTDGDTVMLVTQDAETIGAASDTAASVANFGGAFSIASSSYGADGAGTIIWSYALAVDNAVSGLASNGVDIVLSLNGTVVEGRAGGDLIFTIATDAATGIVTLTQFAEIDHILPGDSANYDAQLATLANGLVSLNGTATITDGDGDMATETVTLDLGGNIKFADDGPSVTAAPSTAMLMVDETDLMTDATADLSGAFTVTYGADGPGTTAYTLAISAVDTDSGLVDVETGEAVLLRMNGNVVEGYSATGGVVFTLSVDANGVVELDQLRAVEHTPDIGFDQSVGLSGTDLITLTATATDGDGDTANGTIDLTGTLTFKDDGPAIDAEVDENTTVMLVTQDAETDGDPTAEDTASSTANFGGAFTIASSSYGADGAGTTVWSYALVVNSAVSGLTSHGVAINLFLIGGEVVGSTAADAGSVTAANTIFTIGTDAVTGVVTLTQFAEIDHDLPGDSNNFDAQQAILGNGLVSFEGTATITDRDGDSASETVTLDLGGNIKFDDDGPSANPGDSTGTVDEDGLAGGIEGGIGDIAGTVTSVSGSVTALFNSGADAPLTYQLLTNTGGLAALTSGGVTVTYAVVNNVLTATAGGNTVFTFTLNATTGAWDFVLSGPLDHALADNENDITLNLGSLLQATDFDGDFVAASGSVVITIDDDTPTATNEASQNVDEGAMVTGTLDFAGGADGATVTEIDGVTLIFGGDGFSQLIDIGAGVIKVKADGSYEFTADASTISPVAPTVATYTVRDADGDEVMADITFQVVDANVPTGGISAAEVDDDGLTGGNLLSTIGDLPDANADGDNDESTFGGTLTLNFGGDGAGSVGFASMDGLTGTVGQETVTYSWNAGSNTLTATGPRGVLFTVQVTDPSTGAYTVTLVDNVLHAGGPNDENDATTALTYTVADADGSTATGTLNITFDDDAPSDFTPDTANLNNVIGGSFTGHVDSDDDIANNVGADQPGAITFSGISNGDATALSSGGDVITLWLSVDGQILQGRTNSTDGTDGTLIYTVSLNQATSEYTFTLSETIDNGSGVTFNDLSGSQAGNPSFKIIESTSVDNLELLFTPINASSVNSDSDDVGVDGQFIDIQNPDAGLRIDFGEFTFEANGGGGNDDRFTIDGVNTVNGFKFSIDQISGGTTADIRLQTYDTDDDGGVQQLVPNPAGDTIDPITKVTIFDDLGNEVGSATSTGTVGGFNVTFEVGGTVLVENLPSDYSVQTFTADGYSRIEITNAGTSTGTDGKFSLSNLQVQQVNTGDPVALNFDLLLTDEDGDTATGSVDINVLPAGAPLPLAPMAPIAPSNFLGFENEPTFPSLDSGDRLASNDNGGLMFQNGNGLGENVALVEPVAAESAEHTEVKAATLETMLADANQAQAESNAIGETIVVQQADPAGDDSVAAKPSANTMLTNAYEAQSERSAIATKAQAISQIAVAATLLAANGRPEEKAGDNAAPATHASAVAALDSAALQNQPQPETIQLDGSSAANEVAAASTQVETASSNTADSSEESTTESGVAADAAMIAEESSGNNEMQPGFDASEFQSASGLQLDMGIAMNMEALAPVGQTPSPVQIDLENPDEPPATVEEIVADAVDGGTPETVTIDAIIDNFVEETEEVVVADQNGGHLDPDGLENQPLPEQVLDLLVQGDAGSIGATASDPMQLQMDMLDAGSTTG